MVNMCPHKMMSYFLCFRHRLVFYMCPSPKHILANFVNCSVALEASAVLTNCAPSLTTNSLGALFYYEQIMSLGKVRVGVYC